MLSSMIGHFQWAAVQFAPILASVIYGSEQQEQKREFSRITRRPPQTL
jgi:hypothetical protein